MFPVPLNEKERLRALSGYDILDSEDESEFDRITQLASLICEVPISLVSLIDNDRQWFKSVNGFDTRETSRELAFCGHTILEHAIFEIEDASKDDRFKANSLVTGNPNIRFYAGYPLVDPQGLPIGSLCVIGDKPKTLSESQKKALKLLAEEVMALVVERRLKAELRNFQKLFDLSNDLVFVGGTDSYFKKVNPAFEKIFGWSKEHLLTTSSFDFIHPDDIENTQKELYRLGEGDNTINYVQRFKAADGTYRHIEWTSSPEKGTGNIFGIGRDITQLKLKEQQLAESEEKLRIFFENSQGIMFTHDAGGRFLSANDAGAAMLGYSRTELLDKTLYDIIPEERQSEVTDYFEELKETGKASGQIILNHRDGSIRAWLYNNVLETKSAAEPYIISNGLDITKRYNLQTELNRTSQMLEQTNHVARIGGWEYDVKLGKVFWSSVTKEIHGVTQDFEPDLSTGVSFYKEGYSRNKIAEVLNLAITQGKPWDEELEFVTAHGKDIWVRALGSAVIENGICVSLYGTFQDINSYKTIELALKSSLETQQSLNDIMFEHIELIEQQDKTLEKIQELKFLADAIPQIVWTSKADGSFDYYNQHWYDFTGLNEEETRAHSWGPVMHPEDALKDLRLWNESLLTGKPYETQIRFKRASDGAYKWHLGRAVAMKDEKGKIIKWFGSCTDIDEYKRALDLEIRINQFEDFNRIVAHNLRGPAGSIDVMLNMIAEAESDDERNGYLAMLKKSSFSLNETLNQLMKVLEVRNNKGVAYEKCDFKDMVNVVESMLQGHILSKKAVINTDFEVIGMDFPKMYLESIFYNMISNALKYSKADVPPVINIASKKIEGKTVLTFADNGLGIDLKKHGSDMFKLNKIFHEGFDSKGVGLFMTKTQIETFGGQITVESQPARGTKFTITI